MADDSHDVHEERGSILGARVSLVLLLKMILHYQ
jgi:hypothetical protein